MENNRVPKLDLLEHFQRDMDILELRFQLINFLKSMDDGISESSFKRN